MAIPAKKGIVANKAPAGKKDNSFFGRLHGYFLKILFGFILFILGIAVALFNEIKVVENYEANEKSKQDCVDAPFGAVEAKNNNKLVYVAGKTECEKPLIDKEFNVVSSNSIRLIRNVEVYQWVENSKTTSEEIAEDNIRDTVDFYYDRKWVTYVVDSDKFMYPDKHDNFLQELPYASTVLTSQKVNLGAYYLKPEQLKKIGKPESVYLDEESLELPDAAIVYGDTIYYSPQLALENKKETEKALREGTEPEVVFVPDPQKPIIGDIKITFKKIADTEISVIAKQSGEWLGSYKDDRLQFFEIREGIIKKQNFFKLEENDTGFMAWIGRFGCLLIAFAGLYMVFSSFERIGDLVLLFGAVSACGNAFVSILCSLGFTMLMAGLAWTQQNVLLAVILIIVSIMLLVLTAIMVAKAIGSIKDSAARRTAYLAKKSEAAQN